MGRISRPAAAVAIIALTSIAALGAAPPTTVNYQGVLRNASDRPLTGTYDMAFRFFDAPSAGNEILVDTHAAAGSGAVTVSNGLFNALLGGGTVSDGAGPGSYTSLGDVFRDFSAVYVEIKIGAETLAPRVKVQSAAYALNATNLGGRAASGYLDTSATPQAKAGPLTVSAPSAGQIAIYATGDQAAHFTSAAGNSSADFCLGGNGVQGSGTNIGGAFTDRTNGAYTYVAYAGTGVEAHGPTRAGWFSNMGNLSEAQLGTSTGYGVQGIGSYSGGYFSDSAGGGGDYAYIGNGTYGLRSFGTYMGGYVSNTAGDSYAQLGSGGYGVLGYGSTSGGFFKDNTSGANAYIGNAGFGIKGYGATGGGFFQDTDNDSRAYTASGPYGIYAIAPSGGGGQAGYFVNGGGDTYAVLGSESNSPFGGPFGIKAVITGVNPPQGHWSGDFIATYSGTFVRLAYADNLQTASIQGNAAKNFVQNHPYDATKAIAYASLEGDEVGTYTRGTGRLSGGEGRVALDETFAWVTNPDVGLTAQVTPRGSATLLYVVSISTTELIVRSGSGDPNASFDYVVHGLRVGFEQFPIVTDRTSRTEAKLPAVTAAEAELAKRPDLARYTALARFRRTAGAAPAKDDMTRGFALRAAIGEYDRDRDGAALAGPRPSAPSIARPSDPITATGERPSAMPAPASVARSGGPMPSAPGAPPTSMLVDILGSAVSGDLLAIDPDGRGALRVAAAAADPGVVGVVGGDAGTTWTGTAPLALGGSIVLCRVDASFGAIAAGDLLVTSATPGHAMRAGDGPREGRVVAKALEAWPSGTGTIRVLVMAR